MVNLGDYSFCKLRGWAHIRHEGTFHWLDLDLKAQAWPRQKNELVPPLKQLPGRKLIFFSRF